MFLRGMTSAGHEQQVDARPFETPLLHNPDPTDSILIEHIEDIDANEPFEDSDGDHMSEAEHVEPVDEDINAELKGSSLSSSVASLIESPASPISEIPSSQASSQKTRSRSELDKRQEKKSQILDACCEEDLDHLIQLATSEFGLVDDETRRIAWPILLGSAAATSTGTAEQNDWKAFPAHRDENQVRLDVDRSFVYYPKGESEKQIDIRKQDLQDLIVSTLRKHPHLCYFQGYHDIVQVLLLVLGRQVASPAVTRLSLLRIRDFMLPSLSATTTHLELLPAILSCADTQVAEHLSHTQPFFALAATLTLYAHDIQEYGDIARLFDFLLAREAIVSIYLFAIIIVSRKNELLEIESDEPEMLHSILSKMPKPLDLERLIAQTMELFTRHPPQKLPGLAFWQIPSSSVLKTTRDATKLSRQTAEDGHVYFRRQATQIERMQALASAKRWVWIYRRPLGAAGVVVVAMAFSVWLRRGNAASTLGPFLGQLPYMRGILRS